ncbi:MAG: glycosyltransferase [Methylacidiphilales bacterium]|nr:glycosyltransferase [Candidatus Methylacidiphilales bacterium]MDW8348842.1 glycosyltransferase [Verrucomicrobiae bacterium]
MKAFSSNLSDPTIDQNTKTNPLYTVSALVSVYRSNRFIFDKLLDLTEQTLYRKGKLQIIVINTASPEKEHFTILKFLEHYPHFTYIYTHQRESVYSAWNRGIVLAQADLITNSNTDDRLRPDALEIMSQALLDDKGGAVLAYCRSYIHHIPNQKWSSRIRFNSIYQNHPNRKPHQHEIGPNPVWKRKLHDIHGLFDTRYRAAGDHAFFSQIAQKYPFLEIPEILGLWYRDKKRRNLGFLSDSELKSIPPQPLKSDPIEVQKEIDYWRTLNQEAEIYQSKAETMPEIPLKRKWLLW